MPDVVAISGERSVSREELAGLITKASASLADGTTYALHAVEPIETLVYVLCAAQRNQRLVLIPANYGLDTAARMAADAGAVLLGDVSAQIGTAGAVGNNGSRDGWLGLYTSGTTGPPKLVLHDWERIQKPADYVRPELAGEAWLSTYSYASYAGIQVLFSALNSGGTIIYSVSSFEETCRLMSRHGVSVVSATPTYWRMLITSWPSGLEKPVLKQATFGGEAARQDVLDLVARFFAPERLTHIYASTEVGTALAVSDGHEGFPVRWLEKEGPVQVRIVDGVLEIRSDYAMKGYSNGDGVSEEGWFRTADNAEVRGDRIIITGRNDGVLNVGGAKISPEVVEDALLTIPGVTDCRVYRKTSPITGHLLAADILTEAESALTKSSIAGQLRATLPASHVPAVIRFVDAIALSPTGKKSRADE